MNKGLIFDIRRYSVHDGPGIRTTVFFKGCPLTCPWCHNPEGKLDRPESMLRREALGEQVFEVREEVGVWYTAGELMAEMLKDYPFFEESGGGVTFSGGEPMMQNVFLSEVMDIAKSRGVHTAVDTSGYAAENDFYKVAEKADLMLFDIKQAIPEKHLEQTGVDFGLIRANLYAMPRLKTELIVRMPLIPGFNDDEENLEATARLLTGIKDKPFRLDLLPFHNISRNKFICLGQDPSFMERPAMSRTEAMTVLDFFIAHHFNVHIVS